MGKTAEAAGGKTAGGLSQVTSALLYCYTTALRCSAILFLVLVSVLTHLGSGMNLE